MRKPRIYVPELLLKNSEYQLSKEASQHISKVLRLKAGDELTLFDGNGWFVDAQISKNAGKQTCVQTSAEPERSPAPTINLHLGLAISKGDRMDYAIQKSVEAGANVITPLLTERTVIKLDEKRTLSRHEHWQGIVVSACEQCGQNYLPTLHMVASLTDWCGQSIDSLKLVFDANAPQTLYDIEPQQDIQIVIGPEGGLATDELDLLQRGGFTSVRMGPRVFRSETAAVSACVMLQTLWGDYRNGK
jgi:16S rRNA (uracil1498-N3)-methyltransferase